MPTADPILAASGGNVSPTTPGLTQAAGGGNLAPTAPALLQAATGGNLAPTAPALLVGAFTAAAAVAASGTITFTGVPVQNETLTVNGTAYTFRNIASFTTQIGIGADAAAMAVNAAVKINALDPAVNAVPVGGVVTITATTAGTAGNSITLAEAASNTAVSGATLSGGSGLAAPSLLTPASGGNLSPTAPGAITP